MKKYKTIAAECAATIRKELKEKFPLIKFKVQSESYSMGNSVRIYYTDNGEYENQKIKDVVSKYQYGHFDGMIDMYENTNNRDDIPQVKFVFLNRFFSYKRALEKTEYFYKLTGIDIQIEESNYEYDNKYRVLNNEYVKEWGYHKTDILYQLLTGDITFVSCEEEIESQSEVEKKLENTKTLFDNEEKKRDYTKHTVFDVGISGSVWHS